MHNTIHQGKKCECKENHHQLKTKAYEKQDFFFVLSMVFATTWMMPACSSGDESIPALPENTEKPSSNPSEELAESSFVAISFDYSDTKDAGLWQGGDTLFTGLHIEGFNPQTGLLYFTGLDITSLDRCYNRGIRQVDFMLGECKLFTAQLVTQLSSEPVLDLSLAYCGDGVYLQDAYPIQFATCEKALQRKEARSAMWQLFITFLQRTGKLIQTTEDGDDLPDNPNTGEPVDSIEVH